MLSDSFRSAWGGRSDSPALEAALLRTVAGAQAAWPTVVLSSEAFVRHLAAGLPADADPIEVLATIPAADLYLACACAAGDEEALRALDRLMGPWIDGALRRIDSSADFLDEARQRVQEHILVSQGGRPARIANYQGRGPLSGWVRVVALRIALRMRRPRKDAEPLSAHDAAERESALVAPEIDHLRARYGGEVKRALEAALATLSPRDRNLLKLHLLDRVSFAQIGALYDVNKSTISRWFLRAREQLFEETSRRLRESVPIEESELHSFMGAFRSRLDLSLQRILDPEDGR